MSYMKPSQIRKTALFGSGMSSPIVRHWDDSKMSMILAHDLFWFRTSCQFLPNLGKKLEKPYTKVGQDSESDIMRDIENIHAFFTQLKPPFSFTVAGQVLFEFLTVLMYI